MIKTSQILVILVLITTPAFGQMVHKCPGPDGKPVYQQKECAESAGATLKIETGKPSETRKATLEEVEQCLSLIKIRYKYKDPDSLKLEGDAFVSIYSSGRKEIIMSINGKNSYGAYAGAKPAYCKYKASGDLDDLKSFE